MEYYFAPMEGITGYRFRQAHHRYFSGVCAYYMPFLTPTQDHLFTPKELREIDPAHNQGLRAVPQLLTRSAQDFLWAAQRLADMGYGEINLNVGCPSGTVVAKGKGAGLLGRPEELERLLDGIFAAAPAAVSVKTRLGLEREEEFGPILELYHRYPIAKLIIHPRVRRDFYRLPVRPAAFERAAEKSRLPLCYNGDLVTAQDCREFARCHPTVGAVMLGRGLVGNPALACQAQGGPGVDRESLKAFHDQLYEGYSSDFGSRRNAMQRMKELWSYLGPLFRDSAKAVKGLRKANDPGDYQYRVERIFQELELANELPNDFLET